MKRKIHKKDLPIVQKMYDGLVLFYEQSYFHTCNMDLSECPIWNVSDKKGNNKGYAIHVFCSSDTGEESIVPLEKQEAIMLRLYNITLDAFKLLNGNGSMATFLGVPAIGKNKERQIWVKIIAITDKQ